MRTEHAVGPAQNAPSNTLDGYTGTRSTPGLCATIPHRAAGLASTVAGPGLEWPQAITQAVLSGTPKPPAKLPEARQPVASLVRSVLSIRANMAGDAHLSAGRLMPLDRVTACVEQIKQRLSLAG